MSQIELAISRWTTLRPLHGDAARYRCKDMLPGTGLAREGAWNLGPIIAEHTEYFALEQGFR
ncbi:hypothetical protein DPV78_001633 [Talaromyces pinophilus]|nr:hypothetical protein DPV78_001633 [Talaromyces pinophilus]